MTTANTLPATKRMTAEEFCDWVQLPENANKWFELVRGEVIELPPPMKPHGAVCVNVATELNLYVRRRRKGYVTSNDSGVILERDPDTVRGPDVALYEDANKWADLHPKYGEVPPRLAVEVLSPNDKARHVMAKIMEYLKNGVDLIWLIDPEARTVSAFPRDRAPYVVGENDELSGDETLPDFRCRVADFFYLAQDTTPGGQA